jgi:hypothetical protein
MNDLDSKLAALEAQNHELWWQAKQAQKERSEALLKVREQKQVWLLVISFGLALAYGLWDKAQNEAAAKVALVRLLEECRGEVQVVKSEVLPLAAPGPVRDSLVDRFKELDRLMNLETHERDEP